MNSLEIHSIDETGRGVVGSKLLEKKEIKADQHENVLKRRCRSYRDGRLVSDERQSLLNNRLHRLT